MGQRRRAPRGHHFSNPNAARSRLLSEHDQFVVGDTRETDWLALKVEGGRDLEGGFVAVFAAAAAAAEDGLNTRVEHGDDVVVLVLHHTVRRSE